jgi:hypothetical protein
VEDGDVVAFRIEPLDHDFLPAARCVLGNDDVDD